jgi:hypothetical protein
MEGVNAQGLAAVQYTRRLPALSAVRASAAVEIHPPQASGHHLQIGVTETDAGIVQRHIGAFLAADKGKRQGERAASRFGLVPVLNLELEGTKGAARFKKLFWRRLLHDAISQKTTASTRLGLASGRPIFQILAHREEEFNMRDR